MVFSGKPNDLSTYLLQKKIRHNSRHNFLIIHNLVHVLLFHTFKFIMFVVYFQAIKASFELSLRKTKWLQEQQLREMHHNSGKSCLGNQRLARHFNVKSL